MCVVCSGLTVMMGRVTGWILHGSAAASGAGGEYCRHRV